LEVRGDTGIGKPPDAADRRRSPRFKLEVNIQIYPRGCAVVRGSTVDISETGISAVLRDEIVLGEVVRLEFTLSAGPVEAFAVARQRTAFRYGFQFVEAHSAQDAIGRACALLSTRQGAPPARFP
jgi:c-di-GMP-binding flagellar brake protein YcgR